MKGLERADCDGAEVLEGRRAVDKRGWLSVLCLDRYSGLGEPSDLLGGWEGWLLGTGDFSWSGRSLIPQVGLEDMSVLLGSAQKLSRWRPLEDVFQKEGP